MKKPNVRRQIKLKGGFKNFFRSNIDPDFYRVEGLQSPLTYFVKKLKKIPFIKTFLVPGLVTIGTAGLVIFLVCGSIQDRRSRDSTVNLNTKIYKHCKKSYVRFAFFMVLGSVPVVNTRFCNFEKLLVKNGNVFISNTVDYAMESSGAWVSSTPDTKPYSMNDANLMEMFSVWYTANPNRILQPGTLPGQCFAFKGSTGKIRINLFHAVYVSAITLEHVHKSLALNRTGAPKDFRVYGLENESSSSGFDFGLFKYKLQGNALQTFQVQNRSSVPHKHVELHILNNHGNPTYTCIYRFRIHGNE
ncbi:hypothetical protein RI129_009480 [Pyrocoelia pectoralis]|uniref:SUN domain-containing protein n=1 Tax=Pyrocoelia pectoralis TaxID=417401 RepID=A0AAN7V655_9COLE